PFRRDNQSCLRCCQVPDMECLLHKKVQANNRQSRPSTGDSSSAQIDTIAALLQSPGDRINQNRLKTTWVACFRGPCKCWTKQPDGYGPRKHGTPYYPSN